MVKKPTLKQIAEITGFSQASVSMILSKRSDVSFSEETVRAVLSAAEQLGYAKRSDRSRSKGWPGARTIAVLCPNISNPYYSTLVQSIEQAAWEKDYRIITMNTYRSPELEARSLEALGDAPVAGIIFASAPQATASLVDLNARLPMVVIGDKGSSLNLDTVEMDNFGAGVLIARHLLDLGHREIAYVSTTLDPGNTIRLQRLRGLEETFGAACPEGRILVRSRAVTAAEELKDLFVEHHVGFELARECLEDRGLSAFVAVNDMVAYGVMDAIIAAGLTVPVDYSVCGFDNVFPSRLSPIGLTTVDNYMVDKGHNAFAILLSRIEGGKEVEGGPKVITRVEYPPRLIVRASTAQAGKGARR